MRIFYRVEVPLSLTQLAARAMEVASNHRPALRERCSRQPGSCSPKILQQRLRLLEIDRVQPFGEPAVDLGEHPPRGVVLPLLVPQPSQSAPRPRVKCWMAST